MVFFQRNTFLIVILTRETRWPQCSSTVSPLLLEQAHTAVIYLRMKCSDGGVQVFLSRQRYQEAHHYYSLNYLIMSGKYLVCPLFSHTLGDSTVVLNWLMWSTKLMLGTESPTSLSDLVRTVGIMWKARTFYVWVDWTQVVVGRTWLVEASSSHWPEQLQLPSSIISEE